MRRGWRYALFGLSTILAVIGLVWLFTPQVTKERVNPDPEADLAATSPRTDAIVEALVADRVYVDPLLKATVGTLVDGEVRAAMADSDTPVHVVVAPDFRGDEIAGNAQVLLARLAHQVGEDGYYFLVDDAGEMHSWFEDEQRRSSYYPEGEGPAGDGRLAAAVAGVDDQVEVHEPGWLEKPISVGLLAGVLASFPLWCLLLLVRWAARRRGRYLRGFSR